MHKVFHGRIYHHAPCREEKGTKSFVKQAMLSTSSPGCFRALSGKLLLPWPQKRIAHFVFPRKMRLDSQRMVMPHHIIHRRCRAELADDAPFAITITTCIIHSMAFPLQEDPDRASTSSESSAMGPTDVRYGAMSIISFIPLFNWLVWVFAWLDTSKPRYLIYSIVYLAPYIKTGFSLSPDDSWLPVASLIACIVHVQLEISVNTKGQAGSKFLMDVSKSLSIKVKIQELQRQATRYLDTLQQAIRNKDVSEDRVEEQETPSEVDEAQKELSTFDEKLSGLKKLEANESRDAFENLEMKEPCRHQDSEDR